MKTKPLTVTVYCSFMAASDSLDVEEAFTPHSGIPGLCVPMSRQHMATASLDEAIGILDVFQRIRDSDSE